MTVLLILIGLVSGCGEKVPEFPQELVLQGGQPYLEGIGILYTTSYNTANKSNQHTVSLLVPEDMPMDHFYAPLIAQFPDGSQLDLLKNNPLVPGKNYVIENIEQYDALGLYTEFHWNGQTTALRSEDLLYPSDELIESSGYTS